MRHSSLQTTQRYTKVLDEDRRTALAVLPTRELPTRSGRGTKTAEIVELPSAASADQGRRGDKLAA
ncbi:hypothetical protein [Microbacterium sp. NIBRBAC000506063]|uniref:hypothetical protein n=1 Tax=Microbacterium sp. NIBRBAC000506063 TaxID=2734618 RepID=UPI0021D429BD|nr:hypothetical protein [Microbacterium sp. NIBRBAC000506063]